MSVSTVTIRPLLERDLSGLAPLCAPDPDPLWHDQFQSLHGPTRQQPFRQTLLAERNGVIVGAATLAERTLHPRYDACAIDVHPAFRRHGIGSALLEALRELHPTRFPAMTKLTLTEAMLPAIHFLAAHRATVYQVVPGFTIDPRMALDSGFTPPDMTIASMHGIPLATLEKIFVAMYQWTHERWNPVGSRDDLHAAARSEIAEIDAGLSSIAWRNGEAVAAVFIFPGDDGEAEVAAETMHRDIPDGRAILAATLRRTIERARVAGFTRLRFDGHVSDPHLFPILDCHATDRLPNLAFFAIPGAGQLARCSLVAHESTIME